MINFVKSALLVVSYLACDTKAMQKASQLAQKDETSSETTYAEESDYDVDVLPKYYANVCEELKQEEHDACDFYGYEIQYQENTFEKGEWLGEGAFSDVYAGINNENDQKVAIKVLKEEEEDEDEKAPPSIPIKNEIKILEALKGGPNILQLVAVVKEPETENKTIVTEFVDAQSIGKIQKELQDWDLRLYMYQAFKALDYANSKGIMHRDLKMDNLAIDHPNRKLTILDWGLADFYKPDDELWMGVNAKFYFTPEHNFMKKKVQSYALDIWQLGNIFAQLLFQLEEPIFGEGAKHTPEEKLQKIIKVLGYKDLYAYLKKFGQEDHVKEKYLDILKEEAGTKRKPWRTFETDENRHMVSREAYDLLSKMLRYDHTERITAKDAMEHPYFRGIETYDYLSQIHEQ